MLCLLSWSAQAHPQGASALSTHSGGNSYRLDDVLQWQRRSYPAATVTSGFWDPRGVSRYRSQPGVHWGYDIAMPYGARVHCAWPGTVEAILPWHGSEVGVRVRHSDGSCATYGHVHALVSVGKRVESGDIIASIASDHLDVKMRDPQGQPFDFGSGRSALLVGAAAPDTRELVREQLKERRSQLETRLRALKTPAPPRPALEAIDAYLAAGILSTKQAEAARGRHRDYQRQTQLRDQLREQIAQLDRQLKFQK